GVAAGPLLPQPHPHHPVHGPAGGAAARALPSRGSCKWIRTPAIIYSVHTMTTLIPILSTFLFEDFSKASGFKGQRPETLHERLTLVSVYAPYLLIPFILLIFMLRSPYYKYEEKRKKK
ncbi:transmembrane protein 97, partial [Homo sapiens]